MQISPFGFVLIHLHQGLLSSSPNVDVNETAVELEIFFKNAVQMLQRGM